MPTFAFQFDLSSVVVAGVRIAVILALALVAQLALGRGVPRLLESRLPRLLGESQEQLAARSRTVVRAVTNSGGFVLWLVTGLAVLSEIGVNIAPLLASVGVAAIAVGFAAQNIIRDYLNGFFIMMEDWYRVGEVAVVDGKGGLVVDLSLRRTVLRDLDGALHNIPNSRVESARNLTREWARINLNIAVAYKEDLDRVMRVINEVGAEMKADETFGPDLLTAPHAERVDGFADSGIEIKVLADTKPIRQWALAGEFRRRLKARFDAEGIEIPWPHSKVYFGDNPPREGVGTLP